MKVDRIDIKPNDDGTFQVEIRGSAGDDGMCCDCKEKTYSAKDLPEVMEKIKTGMEEMKAIPVKEKKKGRDSSIAGFMG